MISYFKNNVLFISNDKASSNFEKVEFKNSNFILSYLNGGYDIEIKKRIKNDVYNKKNYFKTVKKIKNPFYFNSQMYVLDEINKKIKNKKTNLCSIKEAIEVHSIISKLHNEINVKKKI